MESEFPSNSHIQKKPSAKKPEPKKVEKVISGEAIQRKKSRSKRFKEIFFSGADSKTVFSHLTSEIIIPESKRLFLEIMNAGLEWKLYGSALSPGRRGPARGLGGGDFFNRGVIAYNRMSQQPLGLGRPADPRDSVNLSRQSRATHNFDEIVIGTRAEAIEVIDQLYSLLAQYELVSVADLYNMIGITPAFTDERWGWVNLSGSDVTRVRDGYLLDLPRPEPLD